MEFNYLVERTRMFNSLGRTDGMCTGVSCDDCPEACADTLGICQCPGKAMSCNECWNTEVEE